MKIISVESLVRLLSHHGVDNFMKDLVGSLKRDFGRWQSFTKMPRPAMHVSGGVLELMPICDNELYYTFKYVNCHPRNPLIGKQTVVATGQLSAIDTGYPLMFSEMTILTALRTAATSALATDLMARKKSHTLAIIGTGTQSEFQVRGMQLVREIKEIRYFDIDAAAMDKFEKNIDDKDQKLVRCKNALEATKGADIITVCTASKAHVEVLKNDWIKSGMHINALGGDTVGKTELEQNILPRCKIVVEYFDQSYMEGEIQRLEKTEAEKLVYAELYELVSGRKKGRENDRQITLFDSVGIALEDYSVLRLTYELAEKYKIGEELNLTPVIKNPKDLFGSLMLEYSTP
ncbi:ornithine cyclodeaminase [Candidatus Gottesmanbacteria bacterium]|nr:ornithine cyclodeaminase [Candidatus Roizmanbacteria bacterium]MBI4067008.1 ornithine cyclodeaminase [Candidatus Gottesmanbacteria bacterium]